MTTAERQQEESWLQRVNSELQRQLSAVGVGAAQRLSRLDEIRQIVWDDLQINTASSDSYDEIAQGLVELQLERHLVALKIDEMKKLATMEPRPYFGRFDFQEDDMPKPEAFYIGLGSLIEQDSRTPLVYDWRAPISSIFYDYGLGTAVYTSPGGEISGTVSLKRQYRIENGKLIYMFDNPLKIDDEILQQVLSRHSDPHMRNIVNTIQREQNKAIRYEERPILIVEGPAGSGKTSIALHRIAYLLYKHRDSITSNNVIIFSPHKVFSEYIANVLPELGERNVLHTTFQDFADSFVGWEYECASLNSILEELASYQDPEQLKQHLERVRHKSSTEFLEQLKESVTAQYTAGVEMRDITFAGHLILSKGQLESLMDSNNYLPLQRRLAKIRRRILFLIRPIKKKMIRKRYEAIRRKDKLGGEGRWEWARQAITPIREELKFLLSDVDSWLSVDYVQCYLNTLGDNESQISAAALAQNQVLFEDVAPLLYIKGELEGFPAKRDIRHVVVDEAQDYSPLQLTIIRKLFPNSKFTILGDGHQCLNPALGKYRDLSSAAQVFDPAGVGHIRLTKTYRSTQEITSFCLSLRSQDNQQDSEPVVRHGEKPLLIKVQPSSLGQEVISRIHDLQEQGHKSIAVICTTVSQCKEAYVHLQPEFDPFLVDHADKKYHQGLIIIPVYLAKGLEFDAVLIWDAGAGNYSKEYHRNQLYTACSRALHQLYICYSGELSPFIAAVHKELYRRPEHKKGG